MKNKFYNNCGHELKDSNIICDYCGHSIDKSNDELIKIDTKKLVTDGKKASISAGRTMAFLALFMNLITIAISINDFALAYVCMLASVIGTIISLILVIVSFTINKNSDTDEIESKVATIVNVATGIFIFSGCDFLVAINFALFGF